MSNLSTTKLSSKGQVVIPEKIRQHLGLKTGDQFIVIAEGDVVILKALSQPTMKDFSRLISRARNQGKKAKLTKKSLANVTRRK